MICGCIYIRSTSAVMNVFSYLNKFRTSVLPARDWRAGHRAESMLRVDVVSLLSTSLKHLW